MLRFTISLSKFFSLLLGLLLLSFFCMASSSIIPDEPVTFLQWLSDNYLILLLALSEGLALLPGKQSGILKIVFFLLERLVAIKSSKSKS